MQQDSEPLNLEHFLQDMPPLRHSGKHLGGLFGAVFGVTPGSKSLVFPPEFEPVITQAVETVFATLTPREEKVLKMRLGLNATQKQHTQQAVADHFAFTRLRIRQIESKALRNCGIPQEQKVSRCS